MPVPRSWYYYLQLKTVEPIVANLDAGSIRANALRIAAVIPNQWVPECLVDVLVNGVAGMV